MKLEEARITAGPSQRQWRRFSFGVASFCARYREAAGHWQRSFLASLFVIVLSYGFTAGGHLSFLLNHFSAYTGVVIKHVEIQGLRYLTREQILTVLGYQAQQSLLDFDVWEARRRLLELPWVEDVQLVKSYPDRLKISVVERTPLAILQEGKSYYLLDQSGVRLARVKRAQLPSLPLLLGSGADKNLLELMTELKKFPNLQREVAVLQWISNRRWNLLLLSGVLVKLPEQNWQRSLIRLAAWEEQRWLSKQKVKSVDLRVENKATLEVAEIIAEANQQRVKRLLKTAGLSTAISR